ncbi:MAG: hypothetical protein K9K82_03205 [Desulfobacteraceae bacterium]|nr:hypothetical protein [Desulfobacteraceae bacterium]
MAEKTRTDGIAEKEWQWRMARSRMLRYLDALDIPPIEALETACEVFDEVRSRSQPHDSIKPVEEGMQMLRRTLVEQNRIEEGNFMVFADAELLQRPLPPMKQGRMWPDGPDGDPGDGLFKRTLKKFRSIRPFYLLCYRRP